MTTKGVDAMEKQKKKEPKKVPSIKIDKDGAVKSLTTFRQSLKSVQLHF